MSIVISLFCLLIQPYLMAVAMNNSYWIFHGFLFLVYWLHISNIVGHVFQLAIESTRYDRDLPQGHTHFINLRGTLMQLLGIS